MSSHNSAKQATSNDLLAEAAKFIDGFAASGEAGFARQRKALDWMMRYRSYCMLPTAHEPADAIERLQREHRRAMSALVRHGLGLDEAPAQSAHEPCSAPVAWVPIHPTTGPLWANTIASKDSDHPRSYPLMPLYATQPPAVHPPSCYVHQGKPCDCHVGRASQPPGPDAIDALRPFAVLGGPDDGRPAFHDLEDDVVVYSNSAASITAGDVRRAREVVGSPLTKESDPDWRNQLGQYEASPIGDDDK